MRAARLEAYDGPAGVRVAAVPDAVAADGEVLVAVTHCGLNRADVALTRGAYGGVARSDSVFAAGEGLPHALGIEPVGTLVETGERVAVISHFGCGACAACARGRDELCPDMRVLGTQTPDRGGLDERLAVPARNVVPIPDGVSSEAAACVSVGYTTASWVVGRLAGVAEGDVVAVKGATGPVGLAAIDVARAAGARAVAITRSAAKREALVALGATHVVVAEPSAAAGPVHELVPEGADVVVEPFGGPSWADSTAAARRGGTIALVGTHVASRTEVDLSLLFARAVRVVGSARAPASEDARVLALVAAGRLRPHVAARFPLEQVAEALALQERGDAVGKVVVDVCTEAKPRRV